MRSLALITGLGAILAAQLSPRSSDLVNGRFEEGSVGSVPSGWFVPTKDYQAELLADGGREGGRCVHLHLGGGEKSSPFGNLMQSFDAVPWRNKPIRLRAWVRVEGGGRAQMWLRADCEEKMGLFDNMGDRPIHSSRWTECEITGVVDPDAERLNVGVMLLGEGELWIDAVEFEATGEAIDYAPAEPPRALTDVGLANLLAYAELFGYVRHFHPSDQAAKADWDELAVQGVQAVEGAASPEALAEALQAQFAPLAPSVRVFVQGKRPEPVRVPESDSRERRIQYWKHVGFGQPGGVYTSTRLRVDSADRLPEEVPDPEHPYEAELPGGIACLVPISVHSDAQGTLPRPSATSPDEARAHRPSGDDRATRLADVVIAWNIFQHFYPYFDITPVDWKLELSKALRSAATDAGERSFLDTLRRLVAALKDGHGYVGHGSEVRAGSLPIQWDWIEDQLIITDVSPELLPHPAPGDVVLAIDGVPVAQELARAEALISGATPQWIRHRALEQLRSRTTLDPCTLELACYPDDRRSSVEVTPQLVPFSGNRSLPARVSEVQPGIWYIDLGRATNEDLDGAVEQLADASGIVFDLRGYPSGLSPQTIFSHLIEEPVTSAQWHIPLVMRPNREQLAFDRTGEWNLEPREPYFQAEKAFLTGGGAISYAESCMGIVENYRLAEIVGGPTAGTNGNVNPFELPGGYHVSWTGMKVLKHDGSRHHGVGIQPTLPVHRTRKGAADSRDEVLEAGLARVRGE